MVNWYEEWVEVITLFFLSLGFIISVFLQSPGFTYLSVFLSGGLAGRMYYTKRLRQPILPFVLMIIGFLLGYLLGNFWTSRFWTLFFFMAGMLLSYELHLRKFLVIFKSERFFK